MSMIHKTEKGLRLIAARLCWRAFFHERMSDLAAPLNVILHPEGVIRPAQAVPIQAKWPN